jgi:uncharacterized protein involved in type VI secretion and phage assembly
MLELQPHTDRAPALPGLYAGTVSSNRDDTKAGRIQVTVPSVFDGDGADAAVWARPCLPWGHFFVPEVGAKVWVAFEGGDAAAPVWLGTWLPRDATPADAQADPPAVRLVRSAAGHQILLDDTAGSERVVVSDKTGSRIELTTSAVTVHAAQNLTIEAPGKSITISANAIMLRASSVDVTSA